MIVEDQRMNETHDTIDATRTERHLRAVPFIVDNPVTAIVIAFVAGALAGSKLPGRGLITRAARMLLMKELELAVTSAL